MANKGIEFEWCVYHLIASENKNYKNDPNAPKATRIYENASPDVRAGAENAIRIVRKQYGRILEVEKKSGGKEPKTDLVITTNKKRLRCSLKYGGQIRLSSSGVKTTTEFLNGVINNLANEETITKKQSREIISLLSSMDRDLGDLGTMPAKEARKVLASSEEYSSRLQQILGTSKNPDVAERYQHIKVAVVKEAMTGRYTFMSNPDLSAEYILSENSLREIDDVYVSEVAERTSVRLALKGRGAMIKKNQHILLNEIVVGFDTK